MRAFLISKTVVIESLKDIDDTKTPYIRDNEFASLIGKEYIIETKLRKYIETYKEAKKDLSLDEDGEVQLSDEYVIGLSKDIFGEKRVAVKE